MSLLLPAGAVKKCGNMCDGYTSVDKTAREPQRFRPETASEGRAGRLPIGEEDDNNRHTGAAGPAVWRRAAGTCLSKLRLAHHNVVQQNCRVQRWRLAHTSEYSDANEPLGAFCYS
ncbi:Hypothetical protein SMAX5B_001130 [Scophthalmus maximus]|uniref:Uncharacterized protein n=1 Tax=Scophthalmus maximus TaxID=52904 RepID=A0A2U9CAP3_SCOMX|nr:Hypothetical protein SMAX5B_001130 [Scophthalmus maximus]KAF0026815.1 hypothetical protein F2P81_021552 [Scophthalmus maximus]